ncbi:MAG: hypothetical protein QXR45_15165 [Candidatus Bathyarchaeia archaeon]
MSRWGNPRSFPWQWILIALLACVAVGLLVFALLPPTPPPYV